MPRKLHRMTGAVYESEGEVEGVALVTARDGTTGRFDDSGRWLSGELKEADPHLCLWVAGRQLPLGMKANTKDLPLEAQDQGKGKRA